MFGRCLLKVTWNSPIWHAVMNWKSYEERFQECIETDLFGPVFLIITSIFLII
jgi:hypothetical protein